MAKSDAHMCAFDEAGDVGEDGSVAGGFADDAEVGDEGGEGVVGDFGSGGGECGDQGGFAGVG